MKLTNETLKRIIKEELEKALEESNLLKRFSNSKEDEFRQYLSDAGKDPDAAYDAMGPDQFSIVGGEFIDGYPQTIAQTGLDKILANYGFKQYEPPSNRRADHDGYKHRVWTMEDENGSEFIFSITYQLYGEGRYRYEAKLVLPGKYSKRVVKVADYRSQSNEVLPKGFSLKNEEHVDFFDKMFVMREKENIHKVLRQIDETN